MKMRNLYSAMLIISLLSTFTFGQRITKTIVTDKKPVQTETRVEAQTQPLGTAMPVKDASGKVTQYKVALATRQYEEIVKKNSASRQPLKLENPAPIFSRKDIIGYSFAVSPAVFGKLGGLFSATLTLWMPKINLGSLALMSVPLFWQKAIFFAPVGSPYTYSYQGINKSASAVCGQQSGANTVFIIGGGINVRTINTVNDAVSQTTNNVNIYEAGLVADPLADGVYLFGGKDSGGNPLDTIYKYNASGLAQVTGATIPNTSSNLGKRAGSAVSNNNINGKIYLFGGYNAGGLLKEVIEFNGNLSGTGTQKADMPVALRYATAIQNGQYIYIFGGENVFPSSGVMNQTVYRYDTVGNSWKTIGTSPGNQFTTFAKDANGDIHAIYPVMGAPALNFITIADITSSTMTETNSGSVTTISWNPSPNTFTNSSSPVGNPRFNYVTAGCDNIYLIGGVDGRAGYSSYHNYENQVDKYAP